MISFVLRRLLGMLLVLFAVSVLAFLTFNVIPNGDPAERMAGKQVRPEVVEAIRAEWHFDDPLYTQYVITMKKLFTGDLTSYQNRVDVVDTIKQGAPRTFALAIGAALLWFVAGVALGLFTAVRTGRWSARLVTVLALVGISMPVFWLGALASYYLGYRWKIFPNGGYVELADGPIDWLWHMLLPWGVLATLFVGIYSRVVRSSVLDTINEDYVRTERAKGLPERQVLTRHVLRKSLIPVVTLWGLDLAAVLGGVAIII